MVIVLAFPLCLPMYNVVYGAAVQHQYLKLFGSKIDGCYDTWNGGYGGQCVLDTVIKKNISIDYCLGLKNPEKGRDKCINAVAIAQKRVDYCKERLDISQERYVEQEQRYVEGYFNDCVYLYSAYWKDISACSLMTKESEKFSCRRSMLISESKVKQEADSSSDQKEVTTGQVIVALASSGSDYYSISDLMSKRSSSQLQQSEKEPDSLERLGLFSQLYTFPGDSLSRPLDEIKKNKNWTAFYKIDLPKESSPFHDEIWAPMEGYETKVTVDKEHKEYSLSGSEGGGIQFLTTIPSNAQYLSFNLSPDIIGTIDHAWISIQFNDTSLYTNNLEHLYVEANTYQDEPYANVNVNIDSVRGKKGYFYIRINTSNRSSQFPAKISVKDFMYRTIKVISASSTLK